MKYLNAKQVLAVLEVARENSTRDWCMLLLTFRHALRSREVRQLKLSDVSLRDGTIRSERAKVRFQPYKRSMLTRVNLRLTSSLPCAHG